MTTNTDMFGTVLHGETAKDIRIDPPKINTSPHIPNLTMQIRAAASGMNRNQRETIYKALVKFLPLQGMSLDYDRHNPTTAHYHH